MDHEEGARSEGRGASEAPANLPSPVDDREHQTEESEQAEHATDEVDVWWGSYAGRALWPSFVFCGLLTAAIAAAAWYFYDAYQAHPRLMRYLAYGLTGAVWLTQLGRWLYRTVIINYRLTTRRLFQDRGFHHPEAGSVQLDRLKGVEVTYGPLERRLGIGRLYVESEGGVPPLVLEGVYDPIKVAALITRTADAARRRHAESDPGSFPA
jgi:membrane protein YdbS with pleckstrin-like domain